MLSAEGLLCAAPTRSVWFWCRAGWVAFLGALASTIAAIPGTNNLLAFVVDIALLTLFAVANVKIDEYNRRLSGANSE